MNENPMQNLMREASLNEGSPEVARQKEDSLHQASAFAAEVAQLDLEIEKLEVQLASKKSRRWSILTKDLIDVMNSARVDALEHEGKVFRAEMYYKASIPEEKRDEAHGWLEDHEAGDLINRTIVITLPKESEEESKAIQDYIRQRYQMAEVEEKRLVPWKRLTSWLKDLHQRFNSDMAARGVSDIVMPPLELIGGTIAKVVTIKNKR